MNPRAVHLAVYAGLADWEAGYAIAHIRDPQWQREHGRFTVATVGTTLEPIADSR
jgi:hypothetical protein